MWMGNTVPCSLALLLLFSLLHPLSCNHVLSGWHDSNGGSQLLSQIKPSLLASSLQTLYCDIKHTKKSLSSEMQSIRGLRRHFWKGRAKENQFPNPERPGVRYLAGIVQHKEVDKYRPFTCFDQYVLKSYGLQPLHTHAQSTRNGVGVH